MAYDDWDESFRELFESTPGMAYVQEDETYDASYAELLFETGFTYHSEELEARGITEDDLFAIRQEFFDYMGIERADFDWAEWREAMGYE